MDRYVPYVLLAFVFLVATIGLTLNLTSDITGDVAAQRQCSSVTKDWVNCESENGGCPQRYPPYKQWSVDIGNIATCCCAPIKSEDNFRWGQPLYR